MQLDLLLLLRGNCAVLSGVPKEGITAFGAPSVGEMSEQTHRAPKVRLANAANPRRPNKLGYLVWGLVHHTIVL